MSKIKKEKQRYLKLNIFDEKINERKKLDYKTNKTEINEATIKQFNLLKLNNVPVSIQ